MTERLERTASRSLPQTIQLAFDSTEPRPVLIYIHDDRSPLAEMIGRYLSANYIVWPCATANLEEFVEIWEEVFPHFPMEFGGEECPVLIGVHREMRISNVDFLFRCRPRVLVGNESVASMQEESNQKLVVEKLRDFKEEFERDEHYFASKFVQQILRSRDLFLQLIEYLSLNDVTRLFTEEILSLLAICKRKLPIIDPNDHFLQTIVPKLQPEQIDILQLDAEQYRQTFKSIPSNTFRSVRTLIIVDLYDKQQIPELKLHFPTLICFAFHFDEEIDLRRLCRIFNLLPATVTRYEIHCTSIVCSHRRLRFLYMEPTVPNRTIQSFVLHLNQLSQTIGDYCSQAWPKCTLRTILDFIRIMIDVQYIRVVIYEDHLEVLLDVNEWIQLAGYCRKLNHIMVEIVGEMKVDSVVLGDIEKIRNELRAIRDTIEFEVKVP